MPPNELLGRRIVGLSTGPMRIPFKNGLPMTGRLAKTNRARNHAAIKPLWKVILHLLNHFAAQIRAAVIHRHEDALDLRPVVDAGFPNLIHHVHDLREPLEKIVHWSGTRTSSAAESAEVIKTPREGGVSRMQ